MGSDTCVLLIEIENDIFTLLRFVQRTEVHSSFAVRVIFADNIDEKLI